MREIFTAALAVCVLIAAKEPAREDVQTEVKVLIDKAVNGMGGQARVQRLHAMAWKATCTFEFSAGREWTLTMAGQLKGLDKARVNWTVEGQGMSTSGLHVIDGDKGWVQRSFGVRELPKLLRNLLHCIRLAQMPMLLKDKAYTLSPLGEIQIEGRGAVGLKVARKGYADVDYFMDKETGLPVKCQLQSRVNMNGPQFTYELFFAKPREMCGVKHFTRLALHRDGKESLVFQVTEVKVRKTLDADLFAKPE